MNRRPAFRRWCAITAAWLTPGPVVLRAATEAGPAFGPGSGLPDTGASVARVCGALLLTLAVFFALVWLMRNWQRMTTRQNGGAKLAILEFKALGQRQAVYVVGYEKQRMLLGSSPSGLTLLGHLPDAEAAAPAHAPVAATFVEALQGALGRKS